ncbi:MAG: TIGR00341 family protein [Duncaniella sp.]|uniref:TIGR00341 family protein n=1 Tax=Duncaniella sp. TaxID=2518496 RepID=UPI0023C5DB94|nr:TIGR00341 family protein [Duncaniella sp.]MDE5988123.1 TIGR00341 family protein [Duncaniella sp.]MDE6174673.1 TIGR00341 family protein [Duncaniella sp.]
MPSLKKYFVNYFTLTDDLLPQAEAESAIREGVSFKGTNMLILILAIFIASLGLNTNSTAVIIGAMLISPLMGPIIGIGLGVGVQDFELLKRAMRNLVMAAMFSVLTSTIYFIISPVSEGHSELLARTSPTIYDVLIGFFGGGAGIVAIGSKSKGNVIPGVAIATALMPPLCTAGYGLATLQLNYFLGAFYLFLINSIFIGLATFIGVKLMHYHPVVSLNPERSRRVRRIVYTVAILTLLPSLYLTYNMLRQSRFSANADRFIAQQFNFPSTQVLSKSAEISHGEKSITVTLIGKVLPADSLQLAMASQLKNYGLEGAKLNIIQGDSPDLSELRNGLPSMSDIYEFARTSLTAQQQTIDSLRSVISLARINDTISGRMAPELKVIFPQVEEIAITRAVFGNIATEKLDTVSMALVKYSRPLSAEKQTEFQNYLKARLRDKNITLINVGNQIDFPSLRAGRKAKDSETASNKK